MNCKNRDSYNISLIIFKYKIEMVKVIMDPFKIIKGSFKFFKVSMQLFFRANSTIFSPLFG